MQAAAMHAMADSVCAWGGLVELSVFQRLQPPPVKPTLEMPETAERVQMDSHTVAALVQLEVRSRRPLSLFFLVGQHRCRLTPYTALHGCLSVTPTPLPAA